MDDPVAPDSLLQAAVDDDSASIPWHYIDASGETRGPVSFRVIRAQLRCAMLAPDAKVWREGLDEWCEARAFPAFASCVGDVNHGSGRVLDAVSRPATVMLAARPPHASPPPRIAVPSTGVPPALTSGSRSPARSLAPSTLFTDVPSTSDATDVPAWFAMDAAGVERGPMDTAAMLRLVMRDGSGILTRSEHTGIDTAVHTGWIAARDAPALRAAIRTMESARLGGAGAVAGQERGAKKDGAEDEDGDVDIRANEVETLRAALQTTRGQLSAKEDECDELRETVKALRVRIATGGRVSAAYPDVAGDGIIDEDGINSVTRAEVAAAELASARGELEDRTAELVRLKGVLRGELLKRVLEDTDVTRTNLDRVT